VHRFSLLNKKTIKNKCSIPHTDELIDELHGATYFTKIEDAYKTAFWRHCGHFKFLVMPFGFTIVPTTFHLAVNDIFRPHMRKFVLVFYEDILIYNQTWEEHINT